LDVDRAPQNIGNYAMSSFVTPEEPIIINLADKLLNICENQNYNETNTINFILRFVQDNIEYNLDNISKGCTEYWRYSVETLVEKKGDCEDSSVLFASIMKALNYDTVLLFYVLENDTGHLSVGIYFNNIINGEFIQYNEKNYYYCETTSYGYNIGEIPKEINTKPDEIILIN
jgi:hypothetical protein